MPRLLHFFIDPYVVVKRDEALSDQSGNAGLQPAFIGNPAPIVAELA